MAGFSQALAQSIFDATLASSRSVQSGDVVVIPAGQLQIDLI